MRQNNVFNFIPILTTINNYIQGTDTNRIIQENIQSKTRAEWPRLDQSKHTKENLNELEENSLNRTDIHLD